MTKKLSPEDIAEMSEDCQCSCKELEQYKAWWERDSAALGKALNEVSSLRAGKEQFRAAIEQLHAAVKTAQELAARRLMEIERLQKDLRRANSALVRHGVQTDPTMNTHPSDEPCEQRSEVNSIDDVAAICHSVTGLCCHILGSPGGPCTIGNCAAVRGYLGGPEFARGVEQPVATPGAAKSEDAVIITAVSSGPRGLLSQGASQSSPFDSAAILAAPRERRISMSFQTQEQYEAALVFLDMADEGASRDASSVPVELYSSCTGEPRDCPYIYCHSQLKCARQPTTKSGVAPDCDCGTFCHAARSGVVYGPPGARCRRDSERTFE